MRAAALVLRALGYLRGVGRDPADVKSSQRDHEGAPLLVVPVARASVVARRPAEESSGARLDARNV